MAPTMAEKRNLELIPCSNCRGSIGGRSEERRVGKECRSLCDWSSDVCSSDLPLMAPTVSRDDGANNGRKAEFGTDTVLKLPRVYWGEIGRASCRERV